MHGMMERERGWGQAYMGGCCLFVQGGKMSNAKNTKIKYVMVLDGRITIFHTQQPTKNMRARWSGFTRAGATRGERAGGGDTIILGGIRS